MQRFIYYSCALLGLSFRSTAKALDPFIEKRSRVVVDCVVSCSIPRSGRSRLGIFFCILYIVIFVECRGVLISTGVEDDES